MNQNQLTQKETMLLNDLKSHEELCIKKYTKYANESSDRVLKQLFTQLAQDEQTHLNTINQILSGQNPSMGQSQSQGQSSGQGQTMNFKSQNANQADFDLCKDLLQTEKYVSSTYNTAIFEFNDSNIRQTLNHIQKEEQQHGEKIYNYLKQNGGYQAQAQQ